jgi:hypothetical protein
MMQLLVGLGAHLENGIYIFRAMARHRETHLLSRYCRAKLNWRDNVTQGLRLSFRQTPETKAKKPLFRVAFRLNNWSGKEDSNLRPLRPERSALPG